MDAPLVLVDLKRIEVDGVFVEMTSWAEPGVPLAELERVLALKRGLWHQFQPDRPAPDNVTFMIHGEVPASVVKAVVASAAAAGFPKAGFMIHRLPSPLE